jgi:CheY-like chemotaxis protein
MASRVLVVDDHEDTVGFYVAALRGAGYDTLGSTNPNDGLRLAIELKPDLILLDIAMPALDGYELATLVRSYAATRGMRIVAVSAHPLDLHPDRLPPGGWDGYLRKPIDPDVLVRVVGTVLDGPVTSVNKTGPLRIPTPPNGNKAGNGSPSA